MSEDRIEHGKSGLPIVAAPMAYRLDNNYSHARAFNERAKMQMLIQRMCMIRSSISVSPCTCYIGLPGIYGFEFLYLCDCGIRPL